MTNGYGLRFMVFWQRKDGTLARDCGEIPYEASQQQENHAMYWG